MTTTNDLIAMFLSLKRKQERSRVSVWNQADRQLRKVSSGRGCGTGRDQRSSDLSRKVAVIQRRNWRA